MSREELHAIERNEYMSNVKWATGLYFLCSTITLVITILGAYYGLKGDIKDTRQDAKGQIQSVYIRLNSKIDSIQNLNERHFDNVENRIDAIPSPKTVVVRPRPEKGSTVGYFTQRWVDGKLGFFPVR